MDEAEEVSDEVIGDTDLSGLADTAPKDVVVALGLDDGDVVILFVSADLTRDVHSLGEDLKQLGVEGVDVLTQELDFGGRCE